MGRALVLAEALCSPGLAPPVFWADRCLRVSLGRAPGWGRLGDTPHNTALQALALPPSERGAELGPQYTVEPGPQQQLQDCCLTRAHWFGFLD